MMKPNKQKKSDEMNYKHLRLFSFFMILAVVGLACAFLNPEPDITQAPTPKPTLSPTSQPTQQPVQEPTPGSTPDSLQEQEEGTKVVTGELSYTNPFFTAGVAQPVIILEDQGGFVNRDRNFVIPVESQVIGEITSDFYSSPFTYQLSLPAEPNGTLHDVDQDGSEEQGVMIFAVAYWTNTWGDPFLEIRDQGGGGWSTAYASTKVSDDRDAYLEVYGGKYLIFAPDDQQEFPSGFGMDSKLFTEDDPVFPVPSGWSLIDLDQRPFAIDRSEEVVVDLLEPESSALDDFSGLNYYDAFDAMVDKFANEYAFTELKEIDWEAKADEFRPRFVAAENDEDPHAYALALRDFIWSIPDSHVGMDQSLITDDFLEDTAGGIGFAIRETDDGKIIANFILGGGPADQAGMEWGAEILMIDGQPAAELVEAIVPWSSPFSNPAILRLQQLRYATRFKLDKGEVEVTFKNTGGAETTASLPVVEERDSFSFSSFQVGQSPTALPVEYSLLPGGYGYIQINSFLDNDVLSIQVWERAIQFFNENEIPGVILDLRTNSGGSGWLADQMAAYFFEEETVVGNTAYYNKGSGEFYMDPGDETSMIPPRPELQYLGPVAVLIGPACASACEFFSYNMTINDRAIIVGQYPTQGAGGSVEQFLMPENLTVQMTIGRAVDPQGDIHVEGTGVVPTVKVPVTLETLKMQDQGEDVILQAAEEALDQPLGAGITPSGKPEIASESEAEAAFTSGAEFLEQKARQEYTAADYAQPGTLPFTVTLSTSETTIWGYAWCAKDAETLEQNFDNIELQFILDGDDVTSQMSTMEVESNGQQCRLVFTALSEWPEGEHHLSITATFTATINDGTADYEPGDYILEYAVFVNPKP
ncbi:MAG: peptidase S41 [Chloroflexota bacterium]|nr:MAG: peptidase S41 [Chloroflexota bacterium]